MRGRPRRWLDPSEDTEEEQGRKSAGLGCRKRFALQGGQEREWGEDNREVDDENALQGPF
jgi:hypothetical protein